MPPLKNPKWERFATYVASGDSHVQAYKKLYKGKYPSREAYVIANRTPVKQRIRELQEEIAERAIVDRAYVLKNLKTVVEDGLAQMAEGGTPPMSVVRALELLGKTLNMFEERAQNQTVLKIVEVPPETELP